VDQSEVPETAKEASAAILVALGYSSRPVHPDPGKWDPEFVGATASLAKGYWLWLGRHINGTGRIEISKDDHGPAWIADDFRVRNDVARSVTRLLHSWRTGAGTR
jgi:hypothetical protein